MHRGIFGWDLPPGCRLSDIPGNRPEDEKWEVIYDHFFDVKRIMDSNRHGTPITEEQNKIMDEIYANSAYSDTVDSYIIMAIEYGIELGYKEKVESDQEAEYYKMLSSEFTSEESW